MVVPGYRAGRHLHIQSIVDRLRAIGIDLFGARSAGTYLGVCERLDVPAGAAVHIGDLYELDVLTPRSAGLQDSSGLQRHRAFRRTAANEDTPRAPQAHRVNPRLTPNTLYGLSRRD